MCLVARLCPTLSDPVNCSLPGSSFHGILQQEYWSGQPFPSSGDLPDPGIEPGSPALHAEINPASLQEGKEEVKGTASAPVRQAWMGRPICFSWVWAGGFHVLKTRQLSVLVFSTAKPHKLF